MNLNDHFVVSIVNDIKYFVYYIYFISDFF